MQKNVCDDAFFALSGHFVDTPYWQGMRFDKMLVFKEHEQLSEGGYIEYYISDGIIRSSSP